MWQDSSLEPNHGAKRSPIHRPELASALPSIAYLHIDALPELNGVLFQRLKYTLVKYSRVPSA